MPKIAFQLVVLTCATLSILEISAEYFGIPDDHHPSVVHIEINGDPHSVTGCCPRCSGALVSLKHVATVATCLWSVADAQPKPGDIQVFAGSSEIPGRAFTNNQHLYGYGACSRSVQVVSARDVLYHPKFRPQFYSLRHDVAIVLIPRLQATRYVSPIPLSFDMLDGMYGTSRECKMVGYSIFKYPRAGFHILASWLQPLTRWERDVTVTNICTGQPVDWGKKMWLSMIEGAICSKMYSNGARMLLNDKSAALICNGFLVGLVQGQYQDGGKLDLSLRQYNDGNVASGKLSWNQIIFFNIKYLAELIALRMKPARELQWSGRNSTDKDAPLNVEDELQNPEAGNKNGTLVTEFGLDFVFVRDFLNAASLDETIPGISVTNSPISTTTKASENSTETLQNATRTLENSSTTTQPAELRNRSSERRRYLAVNELPEFEMSLVTDEIDGKDVNVDDLFQENNPFNTSWGHVHHHLALVLNTELNIACTGIFVSPLSVVTTASCVVREEDNYQPPSVSNFLVVTGHSNGMVDFCSERVRMYGVQNLTLLNQGLRQTWQIYHQSNIAPYTEIYNIAILTVDGTHISNFSYPVINSTTWKLGPSDHQNLTEQIFVYPLKSLSAKESNSKSRIETLQCRMFGYGHMSYPFTNQKERIGVKALDLEITENCTRSFNNNTLSEESKHLWESLETPHFLCTVSLNPNLGPSRGSMGSPLYCGPDNKLAGIYIGRYNNACFDSYQRPAAEDTSQVCIQTDSPSPDYTHVFLKLADYSQWIAEELLDEEYVQWRRTRITLSLAPPLGRADWSILCLLSLMSRLHVWF